MDQEWASRLVETRNGLSDTRVLKPPFAKRRRTLPYPRFFGYRTSGHRVSNVIFLNSKGLFVFLSYVVDSLDQPKPIGVKSDFTLADWNVYGLTHSLFAPSYYINVILIAYAFTYKANICKIF